MIIVYVFASLLGGLTTLTALSSYGWMVALLCAPLGGSALGLGVAALVLWAERTPALDAPAAPAPA
jgi:uncharacterized iron-regulated membrane protein